MEFVPFNPHSPTEKRLSRLPHWVQNRAAYFVTFRLADALPVGFLRGFEAERVAWRLHHPEPWTEDVQREYHERFSVRVERAVDQGHGECLLRRRQPRQIARDAIMHFDSERYRLMCYVIMPNHAHVLVVPSAGWSLDRIVNSWKSFSARQINRWRGQNGPVWQRDYYDRMIRDGEHLANVVGYIRRNPMKAKLRSGEFDYWESEDLRLSE